MQRLAGGGIPGVTLAEFRRFTLAKIRDYTLAKMHGYTMTKIRGFTLVEILVALAIVAIALAAGMRALTQAADGATALKARTLALWVAQNVLARAELATPTPQPGVTSGEETQAAARFQWRATIAPTPNPAFRRIEIVVTAPDAPDYALAQLVGYLGRRDAR